MAKRKSLSDTELMFLLAWKSTEACAELFKSSFFRPKEECFKFRGNSVEATVRKDGIIYEEFQDGECIACYWIHKSGENNHSLFEDLNA